MKYLVTVNNSQIQVLFKDAQVLVHSTLQVSLTYLRNLEVQQMELEDMPSLSLSAAGTATKIHIQYAIQALRVRHLETRHILLRGRYVTRLFQIHKPPQSACIGRYEKLIEVA